MILGTTCVEYRHACCACDGWFEPTFLLPSKNLSLELPQVRATIRRAQTLDWEAVKPKETWPGTFFGVMHDVKKSRKYKQVNVQCTRLHGSSNKYLLIHAACL